MGRIAKLLTEHDYGRSGIVVIDVFVVTATHHDRFRMPYLIWHQVNPLFLIVDAKVSFITINALHVNVDLDCLGY